ncbi:MAG TPA: bacitracin ABC transporter ATP-binding protein [Lachnospiraceae bacterium]|nr:bacitracin ABC transporter ATP-binding protein [Lachnospiraceae bacterium]
MNVLSVDQATKIYGNKVKVRAVDHLSLSVMEGELVAVMGPSGSGKSTLLNLISGILPLTSGEIRIGGEDISRLKEEEAARFRRDKLGFVFQDYNLVDTLTIGENIMLPLMFRKKDPDTMRREAHFYAEKLGIDEVFDSRTYEVSGGQAQRAAIARAIIHNPSLLLADEPTGNLDSASAEQVMRMFAALNSEEHVSSIVVTHDPQTASFCGRVVFIRDGKVFHELYREDNQLQFYDEILGVLKFMGGA